MHHVFNSNEDALRALREISILRQCHHPNICKILDAYIPKDKDTFNSVWVVLVFILFFYNGAGVRRLGFTEGDGYLPQYRGLGAAACEVSNVSNHLCVPLFGCFFWHLE